MIQRILCGIVLLTPLAQSQTVDPNYFSTKLYPALIAARCATCHTYTGVASGTRLHFPEKDATQAQIQAFGLSLTPLIDRGDASKSIFLNKPTNRIRHTGGERIKPGSEEEKLVRAWVDYLATSSEETLTAAKKQLGEANSGAKPNQLVRRLTHSQYDNTVRDLLGDPSKPAQKFPPEDYIDGFKNQLRTQGMPPLLVENYSSAAERLALNAFRAGDVNGLIPCKPSSATDAKCRDQFVRSFGLRAFRRPLRDNEFQRYTAAFTAQARSSSKFLEGARLVVEAMLQSPDFLFHLESGSDGRSTGYDVASRLSYFLWDTMPDKMLFDAAGSGELRTVEGRLRAARRMLDNPRAHQALDEFFDEWLRLDRVANAVKERRRFPEFSPELAASMVEETRLLLNHLVWDDGDFREAFTADYAFLTTDLASLYAMPAPKSEFALVRFPADSKRAGLLGEGSFLASTTGPTETSPTARGIFVREQLLCQHVPPPPPGVNTTLPDPTEAKPLTKRQRLSGHVVNATCAACHRLMDPIGFGMENFDAIGRFRQKETVFIEADNPRIQPKKVDVALDTQGEIAGLPNSAFSDVKQIGNILAQSTVCQECIVRQMFRYAYGRVESSADQETIHQLYVRFRDSGFHFKELLLGLVESPEFLRGWDNNTDRVAQVRNAPSPQGESRRGNGAQ